MYFYKLNREELKLAVPEKATTLEEASKKRKPCKFAKQVVKFYLNKAKTVWIQSIHYYGGEHFGKPYHFVAEITHTTTNSAFSRCLNKLGLNWVLHKLPFTY